MWQIGIKNEQRSEMRVCVCAFRGDVRVFLLKQTTILHLTSFADGVFKEWRHYRVIALTYAGHGFTGAGPQNWHQKNQK